MTNKETVPVLLRDNRQEQSDALLHVISFEYLVLLLIFRDGLYASPCTESRKRGEKGGEFPLALARFSPSETREVSEFLGKTDGGVEQLV